MRNRSMLIAGLLLLSAAAMALSGCSHDQSSDSLADYKAQAMGSAPPPDIIAKQKAWEARANAASAAAQAAAMPKAATPAAPAGQ